MKPSYTNQHLVQRAGYFAVLAESGTWEYHKMVGVDDPTNPKLIIVVGYPGPISDGIYMRKAGECYLVSVSNINRMVIPKVSRRKLQDLMAEFNITPPAEESLPSLTGAETVPLGTTRMETGALTAALSDLKAKYPELS